MDTHDNLTVEEISGSSEEEEDSEEDDEGSEEEGGGNSGSTESDDDSDSDSVDSEDDEPVLKYRRFAKDVVAGNEGGLKNQICSIAVHAKV